MMNLEQKSGVATTTHSVLTHHLNSLGVGDIVGTMADYRRAPTTIEGPLAGPGTPRAATWPAVAHHRAAVKRRRHR
jgi:hypothetical protein